MEKTDQIAANVLRECMKTAPPRVCSQLKDNINWVESAGENELVVGTQARILYAHREARQKIALAFNEAVGNGELSSPVVLSRDHHGKSLCIIIINHIYYSLFCMNRCQWNGFSKNSSY